MITLHGPHGAACPADPGSIPHETVWIDLLDPSAEEVARVRRETGIEVPSRAALSEVESSSRLRRSRDRLFLSTPMVGPDGCDDRLWPLGFVLTSGRLLTIRFHDLPAFAAAGRRIADGDSRCATGADVFALILEEAIDGLADLLEGLSGDLDSLSTRIFAFDTSARPGARHGDEAAPKRRDLALRRLLRAIGRHRKRLAKVRASLLGLERVVAYVTGEFDDRLAQEDKPRFETIARDIGSLDEFETRLSETLQFLLDAALGLINIEQNTVFRILTVVSVAGIPPTLIASLYGMNFKHMPELSWTYGYPYGLALIAVSALVPLVFFRRRGWI